MEESTLPPTKPYGTCRSDGLFSDPRNCAAYYICRSGLSYHLSCAEKMMFDPASGKCEFNLGEKCRPGEVVHLPNLVRTFDDSLVKAEHLKDDKPKVRLSGVRSKW